MKKKILITGATSGIGLQLANDYAIDNEVIACGRNQQALEKIAKLDNVNTLQFDVTNLLSCKEKLAELADIDVVILNAGNCEYVDINHFESDMFRRIFEINVLGVTNCLEALLPQLKAGAKVVIVGSLARYLPFSQAQAYGASKAAIHYLCNSLRVDLSDKKIKIVEVSPGFVKTPLTDKNQFAMPMRVSVEFASEQIRKGIERNKNHIVFPSLFGWIMYALSQLPERLQIKICQNMRQSA